MGNRQVAGHERKRNPVDEDSLMKQSEEMVVPDLQPSVVARYLRCTVGIHHPDESVETMYPCSVHHALKFFIIY